MLCDHSVLFTALWLLQASINHEHDSPWCMSFLIQWEVHFPNSVALNISKPSGLPEWVRKKQYLNLFPTEVSIFAKTKSWDYPQWNTICPCLWEAAGKSFHSQEMVIWHNWYWNSARWLSEVKQADKERLCCVKTGSLEMCFSFEPIRIIYFTKIFPIGIF